MNFLKSIRNIKCLRSQIRISFVRINKGDIIKFSEHLNFFLPYQKFVLICTRRESSFFVHYTDCDLIFLVFLRDSGETLPVFPCPLGQPFPPRGVVGTGAALLASREEERRKSLRVNLRSLLVFPGVFSLRKGSTHHVETTRGRN